MRFARWFMVASCCLMLWVGIGYGQITLQLDDFPVSPGVVISTSVGMWTATPGEGGADQSWDFSSLSGNTGETKTYAEVTDIPGADSFPTANTVSYGDSSYGMQVFSFYRFENDAVNLLGASVYVYASQTTMLYPMETSGPLMSWPLSYGDEWDITINNDGSADSSHFVVDAWGTLTDSAGTFSVLRVQEIQTDMDEPNLIANISYMWYSPDRGETFKAKSEDYATNPNFTGGTFYRTVAIDNWTSVDDSRTAQPVQLSLEPAYPNPFNSSTFVPFNLTAPGQVTMTVYDLQGRVVSRLVDGVLPAGTNRALFNASGLASGTYFIRLDAQGLHQTQKVQFVR